MEFQELISIYLYGYNWSFIEKNIGQKTMGKITAKIFDRERLEFCCVDLYITQVDVVIAYFVTTRLWIQHNLIINHRQFHQKAPTNFLARCACFMWMLMTLTTSKVVVVAAGRVVWRECPRSSSSRFISVLWLMMIPTLSSHLPLFSLWSSPSFPPSNCRESGKS